MQSTCDINGNGEELDGFLTIALLAYVEVAREQGDWPDSEITRKLAYGEYEKGLTTIPKSSR